MARDPPAQALAANSAMAASVNANRIGRAERAVTASLEPEAIARGLRGIRDMDATKAGQAARAAAEPFTYAAQVERLERIYRLLKP